MTNKQPNKLTCNVNFDVLSENNMIPQKETLSNKDNDAEDNQMYIFNIDNANWFRKF